MLALDFETVGGGSGVDTAGALAISFMKSVNACSNSSSGFQYYYRSRRIGRAVKMSLWSLAGVSPGRVRRLPVDSFVGHSAAT